MSQRNVAAAKRIYQSRNRRDQDAVLAECDPEVEWRPHLADLSGRPIRGHDDVRAYLKSLRDDWESFRQEPERFMDAGDKVVVLSHAFARGRGSGIDLDVPVAHVLTFRDGRCSEFVSYYDRSAALKDAGLEQLGLEGRAASRRTAGERLAGVRLQHHTPEGFAEARERLAGELADRGRDANGFPNGLATMWTWVTEDAADADRVLNQVLAPLLRRDADELRDELCVGSAEHCEVAPRSETSAASNPGADERRLRVAAG